MIVSHDKMRLKSLRTAAQDRIIIISDSRARNCLNSMERSMNNQSTGQSSNALPSFHRMVSPHRGFAYTLVMALMTGIIGCQGFSATGGPGKIVNPSLVASTEQPRDLLTVNSVLILPPEVEQQGNLDIEQRKALYTQLHQTFSEESGVQVVDAARVEAQAEIFERPLAKQAALDLARAQGADSVLVTRLHNLVARKGSSVGANQGTQIDLSYSMVRVSDGKTVWEANYFFEDQALSENILRLNQRLKEGSGLSWNSTEDVVRKALQSASRDFASRRVEQFSR